MDPVDAAFRYHIARFVTVGHLHSSRGTVRTGMYIMERCFSKPWRLDFILSSGIFPQLWNGAHGVSLLLPARYTEWRDPIFCGGYRLVRFRSPDHPVPQLSAAVAGSAPSATR